MSRQTGQKSSFDEAYQLLNAEQKRAVDTIEGPVMVIAGPGTGKTQILTLRIANILRQTDTPPESILALTFTESGAKAMRNRLRHFIGAEAYRIPIHTFHGFAGQLIKAYPDAYERIIGGRPASDIEKVQCIETILADSNIKKLRPAGNPAYYVKPILHTIADLKKENVSPDGLSIIINGQEDQLAQIEQYHSKGAHKGKVRSEYTKLEESIAKNQELQFVYLRYQSLLAEQSLFDFEDMMVMTVEALEKNESMLRDLQERYLYVLADEHQDVNGAQNRILELLASYHDRPNIFVVGDEKQAIYRFQGASLDNFLYFEHRFTDTTVIPLTINYRSSQGILDLSHELVRVDDGPLAVLRVPLSSAVDEESNISYIAYDTAVSEHTHLINTIKGELDGGTSPSEIAVIVRTNQEVETIAGELIRAGIAVSATTEKDVLSHPVTHAVEALIETVIGDTPEQGLFSVLQSAYSKVSLLDSIKVLSKRTMGESLYPYIFDETLLAESGTKDRDAFLKIGEWVTTARAKMVVESPLRVVAYMIEASGLRDHVMLHDPVTGGVLLRRLYEDIEQYVTQGKVVTILDILTVFRQRRAYGLSLEAVVERGGKEAVQVMTAHKSKGLEFTVVCIPHLTDARWGTVNNRTNFNLPLAKIAEIGVFDAVDDERRLLYVAMTRAKRRLYLSYARQTSDAREHVPSRLLEALSLDEQVFEGGDEISNSMLSVFEVEKTYQEPLSIIIRESLLRRGFSATSYNNYHVNPWDYVYRNVLRVPEVQSTVLQFGTVMHSVLEFVTRTHTKTGEFPADTEIIALLTKALKKLPLSVEEYTRLHEKGLENIFIYLEHCKQTLPRQTKEEFSIQVTFETGLLDLPEIILKGNLDRLDLADDGTVLRVVDYKTGKPKTRNEIEGKTKNSDGNYKRQLIFYALLLSLYDDDRYRCRTGALSFVQPDIKDRIHEEVFEVTDQEIDDLKNEIITAVKGLISGEVLTLETLKESKYAHLAGELVKMK
ncbi:MAG: ATP-dependent helicase [Candidatus Paceibacteria bacterium]